MEIIKKIPIYISIILAIVVVILGLRLRSESNSNTILSQNNAVLKDSVRTYALKNGDIVHEKNALYVEYSDLKEQYEDIYKKYRKSLQTISEIESKIIIDSIWIRDTIPVRDGTIVSPFEYSDRWLNIDGSIQLDLSDNIYYTKLGLHNISMNVPITVGNTDKQLFVTSSNPYVHITDIKSNIVYKPQPRVSHGLILAVGPSYDFIRNQISASITVGYGLCIRLSK